MGDFFVMLNCQNGGITPMIEDTEDTSENELATYNTEENARADAEDNMLGHAFGYEVFERGAGL